MVLPVSRCSICVRNEAYRRLRRTGPVCGATDDPQVEPAHASVLRPHDLDIDVVLGDANARELGADVFCHGGDGLLAGLEAAGHRRFEGDVDLLVTDLLDCPARTDLVEGVAHPYVGRVLVGRAPESGRVLAALVERPGQRRPTRRPADQQLSRLYSVGGEKEPSPAVPTESPRGKCGNGFARSEPDAYA